MKQPQTLAQLVEASMVFRDVTSVRQLSQLALKAELPITYTTLNQMRSNTYKSVPTAKTVRALAWLAGVDDAVAFTAAGQPVPGPPLADDLPPGADHLSAKSRKAVIEMVRVLIDLESHHDATAHADHSTADDHQVAPVEDRAVPGQKTWPGDRYDLAAHPDVPMKRDQLDRDFDAAGEENQDPDHGV